MKKTQSVINVYYDKLFVGTGNINYHWEIDPPKIEIILNPSSLLTNDDITGHNSGFLIIEEEMSGDLELQQLTMLEKLLKPYIPKCDSSKIKVKELS